MNEPFSQYYKGRDPTNLFRLNQNIKPMVDENERKQFFMALAPARAL